LRTFSVYAKKKDYDYVGMYIQGSNKGVVFSLLDGSAVNSIISYPDIYSDGVEVGGGWWRFSISHPTTTSTTAAAIYACEAAAYDGNSNYGKGIYIQDAQFEYGLVATDYIESGSSTGKAGVLDNLPRIDYTSGSAQLLMEPSRTNYVQYSEYFDEWASFPYGGASLARDFGYASPEGEDNATRLSYTAGTGSNGVLLTSDFTATASVDYTLSVWMKGAVGGEKVQFKLEDKYGNGPDGTTFTLTNEWALYTDTITNDAGTSRGFRLVMNNAIGVTADQVVYIYGAQAELGSYATSYIPNYGTAGGVTRDQDVSSSSGIGGVINSSEGVLYAELKWTEISYSIYLSLSDGSNSNGVLIYRTDENNIRMLVRVGGVTQALFIVTEDSNEYVKVAAKYKTDDFAIWVNGTERDTDTSGSTFSPNTLNKIGFDAGSSGGFSGSVKQIIYFPTALTNTELAALTTL
jgi:hypothetical protein